MSGGDIDRTAISEAFSKIKEDMLRLNQELYDMRLEQKKLIEENMRLKQNQEVFSNQANNTIDPIFVSQIVKETLKHAPKKNNTLVSKINKKRKSILVSRIVNLASQKNLGLPEMKEILVDNEGLCSKATFYRYITKLKSKGMIDTIKINESEVFVKIR